MTYARKILIKLTAWGGWIDGPYGAALHTPCLVFEEKNLQGIFFEPKRWRFNYVKILVKSPCIYMRAFKVYPKKPCSSNQRLTAAALTRPVASTGNLLR